MQVNYVNAHATSTLVGDIAEIKALSQVFNDPSKIKMNATKSMIGHSLGAAGGMEAIATIKAIQTGELHPTLNQVSSFLPPLPACSAGDPFLGFITNTRAFPETPPPPLGGRVQCRVVNRFPP